MDTKTSTQVPTQPGRTLRFPSSSPSWTRDGVVFVAKCQVHGLGNADAGRRSTTIVVRVAQRPDGVWITDAAPLGLPVAGRSMRVTRGRETFDGAKDAARGLCALLCLGLQDATEQAAQRLPGCATPVPMDSNWSARWVEA